MLLLLYYLVKFINFSIVHSEHRFSRKCAKFARNRQRSVDDAHWPWHVAQTKDLLIVTPMNIQNSLAKTHPTYIAALVWHPVT